MELDFGFLLTLGTALAGIIGAAAIVKQKVQMLTSELEDIEQRLRNQNHNIDKLNTAAEMQRHRTDILASMSSPDKLKQEHRELYTLIAKVEEHTRELNKLEDAIGKVQKP